METETPPVKPRRGRRPKNQSSMDSSSLKRIDLDDELTQLINRKSSSPDLENYRVKLPKSVIEEVNVNIASLNHSGNTKIDKDAYVKYALDLANDNLKEILKKHLNQ